jgi:type 1 glutamine amidotransferase
MQGLARLANIVCRYCVLSLLIAMFATALGCAPSYHPMRALMVVGGQAHDYKTLPSALADRLTGRGDVSVEVTDDLSRLNHKELAAYGVLIVNTCHRPQLSDETKGAIIDFVSSGKGLVVVHCSLWSYVDWPEWTQMAGGFVATHDKYGPYGVVVLDPAHATMLGLGNRFDITDEPYLVDRLDPNATVLVETAEVRHDSAGKLRPGPDPQVWVKRYGKGRVFATTFGHDAASQESEPFTSLLHNGIRWAGGLIGDTVHNTLSKAERQVGFRLLFNGRDLNGWQGDKDLWRVEDGELVGRAKDLPRDSFLVHRDAFGDFVLRFSFRVLAGKSGIQVRSQTQPADAQRPMQGPQIELVAGKWGSVFRYGGADRNETGGLPARQASAVIDKGWNDATVMAVGNDIIVTINGITTARYSAADPSVETVGLIGLQLHRAEPNEVRFRDIRIQPINANHRLRKS